MCYCILCRSQMLTLMYTWHSSAFLSSFVSFHFVFSFLNTGVLCVRSNWYDTDLTDLQQRFLVVTRNNAWKKEESCGFLTFENLCLHCSQFGLKLGCCNGGEIGSLINGWMCEWHLSSSLGVTECATASCSSITCIMRRKRCVQLKTPNSVVYGKRQPMNEKKIFREGKLW